MTTLAITTRPSPPTPITAPLPTRGVSNRCSGFPSPHIAANCPTSFCHVLMAGTIIVLSKYYSGVIIGRGLPSPASCHGLPLITISTTADADRRTDGGNFFRQAARPPPRPPPPQPGTTYYTTLQQHWARKAGSAAPALVHAGGSCVTLSFGVWRDRTTRSQAEKQYHKYTSNASHLTVCVESAAHKLKGHIRDYNMYCQWFVCSALVGVTGWQKYPSCQRCP